MINREEIYNQEKGIKFPVTGGELMILSNNGEDTICLYDLRDKIVMIDDLSWETSGEDATPTCDQGTNQWPRIRSHVRIKDCHNILVVPFFGQTTGKITGPNKGGWTDEADCAKGAYEAQHGIQIASSTNIRIKNIEISNVYGDCVYMSESENIWLDGVIGHHNCRQGIGVLDSRNIIIENCHLYENRRSSIDLENGVKRQSISNVVIRNNKFGRSRFATLTAGGGGDVHHVYCHDNNMYDEPFAVYMKGHKENRRDNFFFYSNRSNQPYGTVRGGHIACHGYAKTIYAFDNFLQSQRHRGIHTFSCDVGCEDIQYENNILVYGTDGIIWI